MNCLRLTTLPDPIILLLSGTSWAGSSPGQHVASPGYWNSSDPDQEIKAIEQSRFQFKPSYDSKGHPIQVSGLKGTARIAALKEILIQLARPNPVNGLSRLEQERDRLPDKRQRILLVVGSYDEAREVRKFLFSSALIGKGKSSTWCLMTTNLKATGGVMRTAYSGAGSPIWADGSLATDCAVVGH
ncbi:MAG: hypothetical protein HS126_37485 [Anaerolineales bacterium]|nr:hypothetical protein [Anaerolineales bacterium]